jgi:GDP-D-mannose dehydratase
MNVLITGAAGQDGVIMSRKLINAGHKVFGICKPTQTAYLEIAVPGISIIEFDLNRYADIPELLRKFSPEVIVNLAIHGAHNILTTVPPHIDFVGAWSKF